MSGVWPWYDSTSSSCVQLGAAPYNSTVTLHRVGFLGICMTLNPLNLTIYSCSPITTGGLF